MSQHNSKTIIGIIGCGHWGPNHIRNFRALEESDMKVAADLDESRRDNIRRMYPEMNVVADSDEIINDPDIDAVIIATPTSTHRGLVEKALLAGKHVFCEKPLCDIRSHSAELIALATKTNRILMTGYVFLFNSGIKKVKSLIDEQDLGQVHYIAARRTNLGPIRSDVNVVLDLASHDISILNWFYGETPISVSATGQSYLQDGIEDVAFISMRYSENRVGHIHVSWLEPKKVREITIVGNRRMAVWDDMNITSPVAIYDKGAMVEPEYNDFSEFLRLSMWDGDVQLPKVRAEEPLRLEAKAFLSAIETGKLEYCDGTFSLGVSETLEAVEASMKKNGEYVKIQN